MNGMYATKNGNIEKREKFFFSSEKEIYLLCYILSIRPEDNKAGIREEEERGKNEAEEENL